MPSKLIGHIQQASISMQPLLMKNSPHICFRLVTFQPQTGYNCSIFHLRRRENPNDMNKFRTKNCSESIIILQAKRQHKQTIRFFWRLNLQLLKSSWQNSVPKFQQWSCYHCFILFHCLCYFQEELFEVSRFNFNVFNFLTGNQTTTFRL